MFSRFCCSSIPAERNHLRLFATTAAPVTGDNELIGRNENALNAISIARVPPDLRQFGTDICQLWTKSPLIKTCKISRSSTDWFVYLSGVHNGTENATARAERWEIAYQIEAIRLNCSHKYYFSHAYAMIAKASAGRRCNVCWIAMWFFVFFHFSRFCICTSLFTMFLFNGGKALSTCGLPSKTAFLHANPPNGVLCEPWHRHKETTSANAHVHRNRQKKIKSHREWRFFAAEKRQSRWHSTVFGVDAREEVA